MSEIITLPDPYNFGPRPVGDLNLDIGGRHHKFVPSAARPEDMPYLLHLFIVLTMPTYQTFDIKDFVNEHQLWHCFLAA